MNVLAGWKWGPDCLEDLDQSDFWVQQMRIQAPEREVPVWDQPLLGCRTSAQEILLCKKEKERLLVLVALRGGAGVAHGLELGLPNPSDLCDCSSREILSVKTSEEGGRFFQMISHYSIRILEGEWLASPQQRWMTLWQIKHQISKENRVSNELRGGLSLFLPFLMEDSE